MSAPIHPPDSFAKDRRANPPAATLDFLNKILWYVSPQLEERDIRHALDTAFPEQANSLMVSLAQKYIDIGREQGLEQGRMVLLSRLILRKFGESTAVECSGDLQKLSATELDLFCDELLDFESVEEFRAWFTKRGH